LKTKYSRPAQNRKAKKLAPFHKRKNDFNVHLSSDLREKYPNIRSLPVRKNDTVLILRGKYSGLQKRVSRLSFKKRKIQIEGIKTTKTDGTEIFHFIEPSNTLLTQLGKLDESRKKMIDRKSKTTDGEE